ncbi:MAG: ABC transporter permease [Bacteroidota bacterium]|nr:ABC transporter permease [Bacteroidota bacterium]
MRTILLILRKEFLQIFRDSTMLPIIFIMPIMQLVVLVFAANMEIKSIDITVVDKDMTNSSQQLISKFVGSPYYNVSFSNKSVENAEADLYTDNSDIILNIPHNFEYNLVNSKSSDVQLIVNAINNTSASLINFYTNSIIADYNKEIITSVGIVKMKEISQFDVRTKFWYNPELDYKIYMLPGILVILVTVIGMFLTAINIVREKEMGTIEQINVTPIKKHHLFIGKLLPFWVIGMFELAFGLVLGRLLFDLPIVGSLFTLFGFAGIYLLVALGIGLFLSTITENQHQVMFLSYFFLLTFILMSGIFTPADSMPQWAQIINYINPFYYFIKVIRMILLKGSTFIDVINEAISLVIYAVVIFSLAVFRYKKTS